MGLLRGIPGRVLGVRLDIELGTNGGSEEGFDDGKRESFSEDARFDLVLGLDDGT